MKDETLFKTRSTLRQNFSKIYWKKMLRWEYLIKNCLSTQAKRVPTETNNIYVRGRPHITSYSRGDILKRQRESSWIPKTKPTGHHTKRCQCRYRYRHLSCRFRVPVPIRVLVLVPVPVPVRPNRHLVPVRSDKRCRFWCRCRSDATGTWSAGAGQT